MCHHPECVESSANNKCLLLCQECDTNIHRQPGFSGHLVLDLPLSLQSEFLKTPSERDDASDIEVPPPDYEGAEVVEEEQVEEKHVEEEHHSQVFVFWVFSFSFLLFFSLFLSPLSLFLSPLSLFLSPLSLFLSPLFLSLSPFLSLSLFLSLSPLFLSLSPLFLSLSLLFLSLSPLFLSLSPLFLSPLFLSPFLSPLFLSPFLSPLFLSPPLSSSLSPFSFFSQKKSSGIEKRLRRKDAVKRKSSSVEAKDRTRSKSLSAVEIQSDVRLLVPAQFQCTEQTVPDLGHRHLSLPGTPGNGFLQVFLEPTEESVKITALKGKSIQ
ncbi:unnamed protein product [Acanthosepion pharaonis]|uniref:Uncharacterized protein n=1 Tax=Acanthosepion pharaonis TaxID=158019 RepID=A0A812CU61_ACAPH|nr:unnamed protein product [Sepia pharaonis]